jgi:PAS domain S-box-containing protein
LIMESNSIQPFGNGDSAVWPVSPATLLEMAPSGWILTDAEGRIQFVNATVERLFDYNRSELIGQPVEVLVPERMHEAHLRHRGSYAVHPTMRPMGLGMSLLARRKDGSEFPVEISLSPVETPQGRHVIAVLRDISERQVLEEERNRFQVELEMERERDRIGMDLHDGIMQEVYAAGLTLELAVVDVEEAPNEAVAGIERAIEQLHDVIRNIRSYIFDLRPRQYSGSLSVALSELLREFQQNTQIETVNNVPVESPEVETEQAVAVYHIVHEALSNVRKHAYATQVSLGLYTTDEAVVIQLRDNGHGFEMSRDLPQIHRGLRNMHTRARDTSLLLDLVSAPGEGTEVKVEIPR